MPSFLLRRLIHGVFVVWGVVTAVFFLVRLTGDPSAFLVDQSATREEIAHTRHILGLTARSTSSTSPFSLAAPRGDFGTSIRDKRPAMGLVLEHLWPATVELALAAALLSTVLAVPLGIISATHKDQAADHVSRIASLLLQSMPGFWLGLLLILLFAVELRGFLPAFGSGTWRHLILPAVALAAAPLAQNGAAGAGRHARGPPAGLRAHRPRQGCSRARDPHRHAFKNAAIPFITVSGLSLGFMLRAPSSSRPSSRGRDSGASSCRPCPAVTFP
jgi:peptide/nickel transport system permease protein